MKLKKWQNILAFGLLLCAFGGGGEAKETINLDVKLTRPMVQLVSNVIYAQVPDRGYLSKAMGMDIIMPTRKEKYPAIVYINGGGFINANKDGYLQQRLDLAEHGYVVASITYRVAPTSTFPAALEDVKAAIRYLRAHADKFNIDKEHIGVFGGSAGGYLSAMAGVTSGVEGFDKGEYLDESSDVQAVVDLYGISDITTIAADYSEEIQAYHRSSGSTEALWVNGSAVFGGRDGGLAANPEGAKAASPMMYISSKTPPFLLLHGDQDVLVSASQTELLRKALEEKHIEATRYLVKNAAHGGEYWVQPEIMKIIIDFFDKHLK